MPIQAISSRANSIPLLGTILGSFRDGNSFTLRHKINLLLKIPEIPYGESGGGIPASETLHFPSENGWGSGIDSRLWTILLTAIPFQLRTEKRSARLEEEVIPRFQGVYSDQGFSTYMLPVPTECSGWDTDHDHDHDYDIDPMTGYNTPGLDDVEDRDEVALFNHYSGDSFPPEYISQQSTLADEGHHSPDEGDPLKELTWVSENDSMYRGEIAFSDDVYFEPNGGEHLEYDWQGEVQNTHEDPDDWVTGIDEESCQYPRHEFAYQLPPYPQTQQQLFSQFNEEATYGNDHNIQHTLGPTYIPFEDYDQDDLEVAPFFLYP